MEFLPQKVHVHSSARDDLITKRVLSNLPTAQVSYLDQLGDPLTELGGVNGTQDLFTQAKRELLLTHYQGSWLKACPGTSEHVCCNLWIVNPGSGCPLDCTYCYLQSYLKRNPTLKLYTNIEQMLLSIEQKALQEPARLFRIGTGEVIDSLVWDPIAGLSEFIVPRLGRLPNVVLELKTKTNFVDTLCELRNEHMSKTVVSWSVNAREVNLNDEAFTATIDERIEAACRVIEAGYRVGFHFDPLIHFTGWEQAYREVVEAIFTKVNPNKVAWVSLSSLRYKPDMKQIMRERFPESRIPFGEQYLGVDGKMRYFQPIRFKLVRTVRNMIREVAGEIPLYMCMESSAAWKSIHGSAPAAGGELVEIFSRSGRKRAAQEMRL